MSVAGPHYSALLARQSAHVINTMYFPFVYCKVISDLYKGSLKQRVISSQAGVKRGRKGNFLDYLIFPSIINI
jgi:hypothetical protein